MSASPRCALFVADWYDSGVGGHNMGDHEKGKNPRRILPACPGSHENHRARFYHRRRAAAALASPNRATQYAAWQKLQRPRRISLPELKKSSPSRKIRDSVHARSASFHRRPPTALRRAPHRARRFE